MKSRRVNSVLFPAISNQFSASIHTFQGRYSLCRSRYFSSTAAQSHGGITFSAGQHKDNAEEKPLVVVLGWLGCQPKHLDKYLQWYHAQGMDTLSFIPPFGTIISPSSTKQHVTELLNQSRQLQHQRTNNSGAVVQLPRPRPVVFHLFSNNGFHFFTHVLIEAPHKKEHQQVLDSTIGCIIDSAPSEVSHEIFTKGFVGTVMGALGMNSNKGGIPSYQHWLLTPIIGLLFSIYLKLPHVHRNLEQVFQAVASQRVWCPQLYLYSNADHLIPATQIEHVIQAQKEVGLPVFSKRWDDTPHVGHFRKHPEEYGKSINEFIDYTLKLHEKQLAEKRDTLLDKHISQEKLQKWKQQWASLKKL